ncbi:MAG: hypothetical protein R3B72_06730 [Polyangiaceae bacterium]
MSWLGAGLCLRRHRRDERELAWLSRAVSERGALAVPALVSDLGALLLDDRRRAEEVAMGELARAVGEYEDRVLGRLAADPRLGALRDAVAQLGDDDLATAIALFATAVMDRLASEEDQPVAIAEVRALARQGREAREAEGLEVLRHDADLVADLTRAYRATARAARPFPSLIDDADVFLLENLEVLAELGQRVAVRQIAEAAQAFAAAWPRRLKPRRRRVGNVTTALEEESSYPTGGFASLAQGSGVANLVPSELIYMDSADDRRPGDVDAFDVRYAEGALLQFVRDEGVITRERRSLFVVLGPALVEARVKDPELPWQRVVILLGWLLAAVRKVELWLQAEALQITVVVVGQPASRLRLEREQALAVLTLRAFVDKGLVTVVGWDEGELRAAVAAAPGDPRVVWLGGEEPRPRLTAAQHALPAIARSWEAWCLEGEAALASLL